MKVPIYKLTEKAHGIGIAVMELYDKFTNRDLDEDIRNLKGALNIHTEDYEIFGNDDLGTFMYKKIMEAGNVSRNTIKFIDECMENEVFVLNSKSDSGEFSRQHITDHGKIKIPEHIKTGLIYKADGYGYPSHHYGFYGVYEFREPNFMELEHEGLIEEVKDEELHGYLLEEVASGMFGPDLDSLHNIYNLAAGISIPDGKGSMGSPSFFAWYIFHHIKDVDNSIIDIVKANVKDFYSFDPNEWDADQKKELTERIVEFKKILYYTKDSALEFILDLEKALEEETLFNSDKIILMNFFKLNYFTQGFIALDKYLLTKIDQNEVLR